MSEDPVRQDAQSKYSQLVRLALCIAAVGVLAGCAQTPRTVKDAPARTVVETAADLPRLVYRLPVAPSRMLDDPSALDALAEAMERDAAQVLETHDIRDKSALQGLLRTQATAALWLGKIDEAHALRAAALEAEDKPALRLTGMLEIDGLRAATRETSPQAAAQAFREAVGRGLAALPAGEVRTRIVEMRADLDITSAARRRGQSVAYADPVWQPDTELPIEIAGQTLWVAIRERVVGPHLPALREALTAWLASHPAPTGADIWRTRAVELTAADQPAPVAVAVWDGGVDRTVFQGRNAVAEGLAFDVDWKPTVGDLTPVPPEFDGKLAFAERITRGNGELRAGLDGPDVAFLRETIASQAIADIDAFDALNGWYFSRIHGTLVADIAARGNPAIRIVPVRITFPHDPVPPPIDEASAARRLDAARASIDYMKSEGVRVVNMSWGFTASDIEGLLAINHVEDDPEKRTRRAQAIFDTLFDGFSALIADAPEILFVIAAGNGNQDLDFVRDMPGSINLPNVLSVGSVDATGVLSTFASSGPSVDLYALGENIEALVPGGGRVRTSGASLSAPQVVNAAAQVLSVRPDLDTAALVELLIATATRSDQELALLDPRAALTAARAHRAPTRPQGPDAGR
ncbi:MAG: S8 family serine peptidase [Gammaproteobacteria bacterium]